MVSSRRGRRRIYWDSCVWLNYINNNPSHKPVLDALLADSASDVGDRELITSVVTQVEVAYAASELVGHALDPDVEAQIDSLWFSRRRPVTLVELHARIVLESRSLMRQANIQLGLKLTPLDAIHLATARLMDVDEFHTYDSKLPRFSGHLGFPIIEPRIPGRTSSTQPTLIESEEEYF